MESLGHNELTLQYKDLFFDTYVDLSVALFLGKDYTKAISGVVKYHILF